MGRKRKSGEGTVRLRKDGRWEGRVVIGCDDKGLPRTKNVLAKTKRECVEKLAALKNSIAPRPPPKSEQICPSVNGWNSGMRITASRSSAPVLLDPMRDPSAYTFSHN